MHTYDFNGDGSSDALWYDTTTGDVVIWLMSKTRINVGDYVAKGIPPEWEIKGVGDFNGDGKTDMLWQHKG
ncbi:FG-GAP repeat-containing protein, partial [Candidatus Magnetobacterium bavaricum]